ncbi:hypothetical protein QQS21_003809 [Conoideocrella luteorostrata]|uniref:Uncharacterized protein n=1 Tax=Conoideocrella luteorostrata TaxID=1105319 RepID=A0AAJ0G203_9HYPO|nr:hypothetical protein QQS21_003809 [Conoideocrella luteorostrata]
MWIPIKFVLSFLVWLQQSLGPLPILYRNGIGPSSIPKFIHDIRHPWIEENRYSLERIDAKEALCNSTSILRTSLPPIPDDLFKCLNIDNNRAGSGSRLGWHNADARLREILDCPAALQTSEHLYVYIYVHNSKYDNLWEPLTPPETLPNLFADLFIAMPRLANIKWLSPSTAEASSSAFNMTFSQRQLSLPTVTNLTVGANMEALVLSAPNLTSLETADGYHWTSSEMEASGPWQRLIKAAGTREHLKSFSMVAAWSPELMESVSLALPHLETLIIGGSVGPRWSSSYPTENFKNVLSAAKNITQLLHLAVPPVFELGLGFDGGADCGNAYFGLSGTKYGRSVTRESLFYTEKAGSIVMDVIPWLKSFSIGSHRVEHRDIGQDGVVSWPWKGRLKEALLEQWPRYAGGDPEIGDGRDKTEDPDGPVFWSFAEDEIMLADDWTPHSRQDVNLQDLDLGMYELDMEDIE